MRLRRQWLAYVPLAFYLVWLMVRYRSATLYTAANPGIPTGGMTGESKSAILDRLARIEGVVPGFVLVPAELSPRERVRLARQWMKRAGTSFPVVLKPDVGERGRAVTVVRRPGELARQLLALRETAILQQFAHGLKFGVYYRRMPGELQGRVLSVAQFSYPEVAGGERLSLVEAGFDSHSAVYADRRELISAKLEDRIHAIGCAHPGFFVGRFDVCAAGADDLRRGIFKVLELNGVSSEPMHIYDPATGIGQALRALREHWSAAFAIGAANRARGAALTPLWTLLRLIAREHAIHLASNVQLSRPRRRGSASAARPRRSSAGSAAGSSDLPAAPAS